MGSSNFTVLVVALALLAITAGCLHSEQQMESPLEAVPSEADGVVYFDASVLEDPDVERVGNKLLEVASKDPEYEGPTGYDEALEELSNATSEEYGFDPLDVDEMVGFWRLPSWNETADEFDDDWLVGAVFRTSGDTRPSDFFDGELVSVEEYADGELFRMESTEREFDNDEELYVGTLSEGDFVVGGRESVEKTLDVDAGAASPLSPDTRLRQEYEAVPDGYLKIGAVIPEEVVDPVREDVEDEELFPLNYDLIFGVRSFSAVYSLEDGVHETETRMTATDEEVAKDLEDVMDGYVSLSRSMASPSQREAYEDVEISRDGTTVTITDETTVDEVIQAVEELEPSALPDYLFHDTPETVPTAAVFVDFDEEANEATVTVANAAESDKVTVEALSSGDTATIEPVEEGDEATVELSPDGDTVQVTTTAEDSTSLVTERDYTPE